MSFRIPFARPDVTSAELEHVTRCLTGGQISGDGPFTKQCQQIIETTFRATRALLTTSCTSALEMAALLCDLAPGDEVIMPSYTFVSTANAFLLRGARPVFVDVRPDTLNLDERLVPEAITPRTRRWYRSTTPESGARCARSSASRRRAAFASSRMPRKPSTRRTTGRTWDTRRLRGV